MTNQNYGAYRDKPDLFDENEEEFAGEESDISAEVFPVIPTPDVEPMQEKSPAAEDKTTKPAPQDAPLERTADHKGPMSQPQATGEKNSSSLWTWPDSQESQQLRTQWNEIQSEFVEDPRQAVQQADAFVAEVVDKTKNLISREMQALEKDWKAEQDISTEDLRQVMQRYRSFFKRITFNE